MSNIEEYESLALIGSGNFGKVFRARVTKGNHAGQIVAVKQIVVKKSDEKNGIPTDLIREIALLRMLNTGKNIIRLLEVKDLRDKKGRRVYHLIFELMEMNLREYVEKEGGKIDAKDIKGLMYQLCSGVSFLHSHSAMHRDLKPDNVLLDSSLRLKISDFGCGRQFSIPTEAYSLDNLQSGYKAPEGLLSMTNYTISADMWSVGCIFVYLASGTEPFKAPPERPEVESLDLIFDLMGTPTEDEWPEISRYAIKGSARKPLPRSWFKVLDDYGYDLLENMLQFNPSKRISALQAMNHGYFRGLKD